MESAKINAAETVDRQSMDLRLTTDRRHYMTEYQARNVRDAASGPEGGTANWHEPTAMWTTRAHE